MAEVTVHDVVKILMLDEKLLNNWSTFYDSLDLSGKDKRPLQTKDSRAEPIEPIFAEILKIWVGEGITRSVEELAVILEGNGLKNTAGILRLEYGGDQIVISKQPTGRIEGSFGISPPVQSFSGRTNELHLLRTWFKEKKRLVKITGMGGIGKSQLARKFVSEISQLSRCAWLIGETSETLKNSLLPLCEKLDIKSSNYLGEERNVSDVLNEAFHRYPFGLLVIDNVDESNDDAVNIIKDLKDMDCTVLVTSRDSSIISHLAETVHLKFFTSEETQSLVRRFLPETTKKEIRKLSFVLGNYPLALQQSIGYIKEHENDIGGYTIEHYITAFEKEEQSMNLLDFALDGIYHDYQMSTLVTWQITITKLKKTDEGKVGFHLLEIISFMEADGISVQLLQKFLPNEDICGPLGLLKRFSMIVENNYIISVHQLVQKVTRRRVTEPTIEIMLQSVQRICKTVSKQDIVHVISIWTFTSQSDVFKKYRNFSLQIAFKLFELDLTLTCIDFIRTFLPKLAKVLCLHRIQRSTQVSTYQSLKNALGFHRVENALWWLSMIKVKISPEFSERMVTQCELILGDEHRLTLEVKRLISFIIFESIKLEKALDLAERIGGTDIHPEVYNDSETRVGEKTSLAAYIWRSIEWCLYTWGDYSCWFFLFFFISIEENKNLLELIDDPQFSADTLRTQNELGLIKCALDIKAEAVTFMNKIVQGNAVPTFNWRFIRTILKNEFYMTIPIPFYIFSILYKTFSFFIPHYFVTIQRLDGPQIVEIDFSLIFLLTGLCSSYGIIYFVNRKARLVLASILERNKKKML